MAAEGPPLLTLEAFAAPHAFTTRHGGVSRGAFAALNLGLSVADDPEAVHENRRRVLRAFGARPDRVATLHQVHGARVVHAAEAGPDVQADALVSDDPEWTLAISVADCVPVLLHDPESGAVGALHAGWRGTAAGVVGATVREMVRHFGSRPTQLRAAIGPAISGPAYQVGGEVVRAFREADLDADVVPDAEPGRYRVSVASAVRHALLREGVRPDAVAWGDWCTASRPDLFFSHRRDRGRTGRHWALVRAA